MSAVMPAKKLMRIKEWAKLKFADADQPHPNTLRRWTHDGRIYPQPKLIGNHWYVEECAEYQGDR
jgi:predicted site-specific integrase-resolvase